jgi:hypothetical protein
MFRLIAHQDDIVRRWRLTSCILLISATSKHFIHVLAACSTVVCCTIIRNCTAFCMPGGVSRSSMHTSLVNVTEHMH